MMIIPAIDLKDGRCVRLRQGVMQDETVYSHDPAEVARRWEGEGAKLLHHQLAFVGSHVEPLGQGPEGDAPSLKVLHNLEQMNK